MLSVPEGEVLERDVIHVMELMFNIYLLKTPVSSSGC